MPSNVSIYVQSPILDRYSWTIKRLTPLQQLWDKEVLSLDIHLINPCAVCLTLAFHEIGPM
jgi:hypothetical protein